MPEIPSATPTSSRGQTIAQKIIARAAGRQHVEPGEYVNCVPDQVVTQELQWPMHKRNLERIGAKAFARPDKAIIVIDHTPSAATGSPHWATHRLLKDLTQEFGVENFFGPQTGLRHLVLAERGFARPGTLIFSDEGNIASIGAFGALNVSMASDVLVPLLKDENWVAVPKTVRVNLIGKLGFGVTARDLIQTIIRDYETSGEFLQCCIEYGGPALSTLTLDDRQTILASTFHTGADTAIMDIDDIALEYVAARANGRPWEIIKSDPDAEYALEITYDLSALAPMVTVPPRQSGATDVTEVAGKRIDHAAVGSCAGNRLDDMRATAAILRGRKIARHVTMYISPGSQNVYADAAREGLLEIFANAGAAVLSPGCNTCWGYLGVMSDNEVSITTHQFNYQGRNGSTSSYVHLASPYTVAASAVAGEIVDPRPYLETAAR